MALDLRNWLTKVDELGELNRLERVHWDLELGCVSNLNVKRGDRRALLFDNIVDYPKGYRVLTSSITTPSRFALSLGLSPGISETELYDSIRRDLPRWQNEMTKYSPRTVKTGSVLENVHSGGDIDLLEFPVPRWHDKDGGRYIGTGCAVITRDPETNQANLGTYRIMVQDKKTTALYSSPGKHGRVQVEKYHAQGQAAPVAISIGHHPMIFVMAALGAPHLPLSEYEFMSAAMKQPVEVIQEEVTGLPIPADAEIVIAGWCPPGKLMPEGPFGEFTGYYGSRRGLAPIIEIERVYHRGDPIILGAPPERNPNDYSYSLALFHSAMLHNQLVNNGYPDVKKAWVEERGHFFLSIISLKQRYAGQSKQVALCAAQSRVLPMGRYVIVVDDDIDPSNINDVIWAVCTRSDPQTSMDIVQRAWFSPLDPTVPERPAITLRSKAVIDACRPFERREEFPDVIYTSPELVQETARKWGGNLHLREKE